MYYSNSNFLIPNYMNPWNFYHPIKYINKTYKYKKCVRKWTLTIIVLNFWALLTVKPQQHFRYCNLLSARINSSAVTPIKFYEWEEKGHMNIIKTYHSNKMINNSVKITIINKNINYFAYRVLRNPFWSYTI